MKNSNSKGSLTPLTRTATDTMGPSATPARIQVEREYENLRDSRTEALRIKRSTKFIVSIMAAYLIAVFSLMLLLVYLS